MSFFCFYDTLLPITLSTIEGTMDEPYLVLPSNDIYAQNAGEFMRYVPRALIWIWISWSSVWYWGREPSVLSALDLCEPISMQLENGSSMHRLSSLRTKAIMSWCVCGLRADQDDMSHKHTKELKALAKQQICQLFHLLLIHQAGQSSHIQVHAPNK